MINTFIVEKALKEAFIEDNHYLDLTSDYLISAKTMAKGTLTAKADGLICGIHVAQKAFELCDQHVKITPCVDDGDIVAKGQVLMLVEGRAQALLKAERIALNFLQRMSGIATLTNQYVQALGQSIMLVDTRKTTPLFRPFEKYSVFVGGGRNHRYNLSDAIMIKDNHIVACGGITAAVNKAKSVIGHTVKIEVEVESIEELKEAIYAGAHIVMLDNMTSDDIKQAVLVRNDLVNQYGRVILEVSGNVTLERIPHIKNLGIDVVSSGALTHSYSALDISLNIELVAIVAWIHFLVKN